MSNIIIEGKPSFRKKRYDNDLIIAEFFCDTIQGEGIYTGHPATFLRLKNCTLDCCFCDSSEVWRQGNPYSIENLLELMKSFDLLNKFKQGQHLVITGGSPLLQQRNLIHLINEYVRCEKHKPFIEVENEVVLKPYEDLLDLVDCWNNSPKLSNSNIDKNKRYKPEVISFMSSLDNSWFKFVISEEEQWKEIEEDFINTNLIRRDQIILMPQGLDREELCKNREKVVNISIRENVKYSTREHIILWDKKTGV